MQDFFSIELLYGEIKIEGASTINKKRVHILDAKKQEIFRQKLRLNCYRTYILALKKHSCHYSFVIVIYKMWCSQIGTVRKWSLIISLQLMNHTFRQILTK